MSKKCCKSTPPCKNCPKRHKQGKRCFPDFPAPEFRMKTLRLIAPPAAGDEERS